MDKEPTWSIEENGVAVHLINQRLQELKSSEDDAVWFDERFCEDGATRRRNCLHLKPSGKNVEGKNNLPNSREPAMRLLSSIDVVDLHAASAREVPITHRDHHFAT